MQQALHEAECVNAQMRQNTHLKHSGDLQSAIMLSSPPRLPVQRAQNGMSWLDAMSVRIARSSRLFSLPTAVAFQKKISRAMRSRNN